MHPYFKQAPALRPVANFVTTMGRVKMCRSTCVTFRIIARNTGGIVSHLHWHPLYD